MLIRYLTLTPADKAFAQDSSSSSVFLKEFSQVPPPHRQVRDRLRYAHYADDVLL
ncbi:MAG: hypothetical protein ACRDRS_16275 [Pseudonocardiaceae bacterium]